MFIYFIIGWFSFLAIFYIGVWIEYAYYRYNLPKKVHILMDAFTEEGEE